MARISELVKTYKVINDPNAPGWNIKFIGALAIAALAVFAIGAGMMMRTGEDVALTYGAAAPGATSEPAPAFEAPLTVIVGEGLAQPLAAIALAEWKAAHPDAEIVSEGPRTVDGAFAGYVLSYRP